MHEPDESVWLRPFWKIQNSGGFICQVLNVSLFNSTFTAGLKDTLSTLNNIP